MIKQVIVVRTDLSMRKGKMVAAGSHASLNSFLLAHEDFKREWFDTGHTKICCGASSEEELTALFREAVAAGLPASLILDEGRTEFNGVKTLTAMCVGPASSVDIDKITGSLKLL
jgi:peptidyl-tRNA hydrolase, PTH2 family